MGLSRHRRAERDGIVPAPQSGEGWDRLGTTERRGMGSHLYGGAESDDLVPSPQTERDGIAPVPHSED